MAIPIFDVKTAFETYRDAKIQIWLFTAPARQDATWNVQRLFNGLRRAVDFVKADVEYKGYGLSIFQRGETIIVSEEELRQLLRAADRSG